MSSPPSNQKPFDNAVGANREKSGWINFFEHPLLTLPIGTLSGLIGMFYFWPILVVCGACILLAFHRSGVVKGNTRGKIAFAYIAIFLVTTSAMYGAGRLIDRGGHAYIQGIGDVLYARIKPLIDSKSENHVTNDTLTVEVQRANLPKQQPSQRASPEP